MIRILNSSNRNEIEEILKSQNSLMRFDYTLSLPEIEQRINVFFDKGFIIGYYREDILISMVVAVPWTALPYYTLSAVYVKKGVSTFFSARKTGILECIEHMVSSMELRGLYTLYFSRSAGDKWTPLKRIAKGRDVYPSILKYDFFIEEIIEPNCLPKYETHFKLLGNRTWPIKTEIIRYSLCEKYRGNYGLVK